MTGKIPERWQMTILSNVADLKGGIAKGKKRAKAEPVRLVPFLRVANVQAGFLKLDEIHSIEATESEIAKILLKSGDVLFNEGGDRDKLGRGWVWEGQIPECVHQNHVFRARPKKDIIDPFFLSYWGNSQAAKEYFEEEGKQTVNLASISLSKLGGLPLPLPPLPEQRRIVARLKALLAKVDTSRQRLNRIPTILKHFRQAVLAAACEGRLTEDWRIENHEMPAATTVLRRLKTPVPEPFLNTFEDTSATGLPDSWAWIQLGRLGRTAGGGTPSKDNEAFWAGTIPWVSPKDMKRDRIRDSEDHITPLAIERSTVNRIPKGSILFVIRGMILNHTLPVAVTDDVVTINQDMKALIPEIPETSEYLFLASKHVARAILFEVKEATHGTRRIETPLLKNWAVPFPPLEEQHEIVRRVSHLFAIADQIEARYTKAKIQVDRFTHSILAKAFRGELVPQDPNDEPAETLLAKLKIPPTEIAPAKRRGRPRKAGG
ncbi:MAG: restriction endonuclease subunit S [Holophagaceae bacterium]|nr:restriction endonuclease subunit S [Holophagaceae bacterium]